MTPETFEQLAIDALETPINHESGYVKLFAGAGYNYLPLPLQERSGNLPLLFHGVTDKNEGAPRDAVVLFLNHHSRLAMGIATKDETGFTDIMNFLRSSASFAEALP